MTVDARMENLARFDRIYVGDSLLHLMEIRTGDANCRLHLDVGKILKPGSKDIFDPQTQFSPASLVFKGLRSVNIEGGHYELNSTIVDFGAKPASVEGLIEFFFVLTGGITQESFMARLNFVARSCDLEGEVTATSTTP